MGWVFGGNISPNMGMFLFRHTSRPWLGSCSSRHMHIDRAETMGRMMICYRTGFWRWCKDGSVPFEIVLYRVIRLRWSRGEVNETRDNPHVRI